MSDNLKKKKLDSKRIALGQKHEVDYLKKIAKKLIKLCDTDIKVIGSRSEIYFSRPGNIGNIGMATQSIRRIAKALLKALEKLK